MENKKVSVKTDKLNVFAVLNMDSAPEKDNLSAPAAVHYLIELLLLLFLILALIISGSRKKKLKALKNDKLKQQLQFLQIVLQEKRYYPK